MWSIWYCFVALAAIGQPGHVTAGSEPASQILREVLDPSSSRVFIAAHRGGYQDDKQDAAPENSVANIKNCESKGYELFETDIQRTKDGHFVMVHDPTIDRETSGAGKASEMEIAELKRLRKRYRDGSLSSERVATLDEFLEQGKGRTLFKADMKPGVSRYFDDIMKRVVAHKAIDGIIFRVTYREARFYEQYREGGGLIARHTLMFMVSSKKQVDDIKARFNAATIEIKLDRADPTNPKALELIRYATDKGFVVEAHAEGGEKDWLALIEAGVRIFHTRSPSKQKMLLETRKAVD
jgi:hypothetical protein